MEIKAQRLQPYVKQLQCDRCGMVADANDREFLEFTQIKYTSGYGSILGDQNLVIVDLCQHCLKETLGPWLRVEDPLEGPRWGRLDRALEKFDPELHGGEFPTERPSSTVWETDGTSVDQGQLPEPPDGFAKWLDYAVATMDLRSAQQAFLFKGEDMPSRDAIRMALLREIDQLRSDTSGDAGSSASASTRTNRYSTVEAEPLEFFGQELKSLRAFRHEGNCQGNVQLVTSQTGIGRALEVRCSEGCRPELNITDYSAW